MQSASEENITTWRWYSTVFIRWKGKGIRDESPRKQFKGKTIISHIRYKKQTERNGDRTQKHLEEAHFASLEESGGVLGLTATANHIRDVNQVANIRQFNSLTVYSPFICIYLFIKVNNGEEVSFEALGLIRETDFLNMLMRNIKKKNK